MKELNIGGDEPLFEGFDTIELELDCASIQRRTEEDYTKRLARLRKHCIGNFKTNLRCLCKAYITDHATEQDPDTPASLRDMLVGSAREQVERFRPHHRYWCDACGLTYRASVIEGSRGWVPQERRMESVADDN